MRGSQRVEVRRRGKTKTSCMWKVVMYLGMILIDKNGQTFDSLLVLTST